MRGFLWKIFIVTPDKEIPDDYSLGVVSVCNNLRIEHHLRNISRMDIATMAFDRVGDGGFRWVGKLVKRIEDDCSDIYTDHIKAVLLLNRRLFPKPSDIFVDDIMSHPFFNRGKDNYIFVSENFGECCRLLEGHIQKTMVF